MTTAASAPIRTAPLALWRVAEAFLRALHVLFGAPEDVAGEGWLARAAHRRLASWLRCGEAMLRRLIMIEAAAQAPANAPARQRARRRTRKAMAFTADQPQAWRVSLRVFSAPGGARAARASGARVPLRSAWPLAERYEALLRAFNDPAPYARRLARRLDAAPHRLAAALRAPEEARHRVDAFDALTRRAEDVWRRRFSSA
jgi:hypothetical protein